jgi:transposase
MAEIAEMRRCVAEGMSLREVGRQFGRNNRSVFNYTQDLSKKNSQAKRERTLLAVEYVRAGFSYAEAAERHNVTIYRVMTYCKASGVQSQFDRFGVPRKAQKCLDHTSKKP